MVRTKQLIPEVYSESFDMSIFTGLLDLIYTARELDQLRAKVCHSPQHCFEEDLPQLASLFNLPISSGRQLLTDYRQLIQHKGTTLALQALAAFATHQLPKEGLVTVVTDVATSPCYTCTITAYLDFSTLDEEILEKLIYKLAPIGAFVQVKPIEELPV